MPDAFFGFGEIIGGVPPDNLTLPIVREVFDALSQQREFTFIEARRLGTGENYCEALVVDCTNEAVPTRNTIGVNYQERLALVFRRDPNVLPEVRPLRCDFPVTAHQN